MHHSECLLAEGELFHEIFDELKLCYRPDILFRSADVGVGHDTVRREVISQNVGGDVKWKSSHVKSSLPHVYVVHLIEKLNPVCLPLGVILLKVLGRFPVVILDGVSKTDPDGSAVHHVDGLGQDLLHRPAVHHSHKSKP